MSAIVRLAALEDLRGQDAAVAILSGLAATDPTPPLLLTGPRGVGKRTAAQALAAAQVCRTRTDEPAAACRTCSACQRIAQADHVTRMREKASSSDSPRVYPDAGVIGVPKGKTRISVLQARDIAQSLSVQPFELPRRIYIVDEADRMTNAAANALLKTLEEPPDYALLILTTSAPWRLPMTVRSRLRSIPFGALSPETVEALLRRGGDVDPSEVELRARWSRGSVARALSIDLDQHGAQLELWTQILGKLSASDGVAALAVAAGESFGKSPEFARAALELLADIVRDAATYGAGATPHTLDAAQCQRLAPLAMRWIESGAMDRVDRLRDQIERFNRNPRMTVEGAVLQLSSQST